jgi:hypothetical protein
LKRPHIASILRSPDGELVANEIFFADHWHSNPLKLDHDATWPRVIEFDAGQRSK